MENEPQASSFVSNISKNNLLIPVAIVIAGTLVAGALFLTRKDATDQTSSQPKNQYLEKNLVAVTPEDHILGPASAPILIVEYSDTDCPYCQIFHETLHGIIDTNKASGKVAWVYRHFSFHPNAPKEAEATECVAEIGGNEKFWQYLDTLFDKKDFNKQPYKGFDPAELPTLAASVGVNKTSVAACLKNNTYAKKVAEQYQDVLEAGGTGTPYVVILSKAQVSKETRKIVEEANDKFLAQSPTSPDVLYVSSDKHKVVARGAMPSDLMNSIIASLAKAN